MPNPSFSPVSRRRLLRVGLLAVALGAVGCGEPAVKMVTNPAGAKGNRSRLKALVVSVEQLKAKRQRPK